VSEVCASACAVCILSPPKLGAPEGSFKHTLSLTQTHRHRCR
jgi:hypothetical protein